MEMNDYKFNRYLEEAINKNNFIKIDNKIGNKNSFLKILYN